MHRRQLQVYVWPAAILSPDAPYFVDLPPLQRRVTAIADMLDALAMVLTGVVVPSTFNDGMLRLARIGHVPAKEMMNTNAVQRHFKTAKAKLDAAGS